MTILGISCFYHESAAALLIDGKVVAASAEERVSRKKHDPGFPAGAIDFCLSYVGIKASDLDYIVFYEKPLRKFERNLLVSLQYFPKSASFFVESMRNFLTEKLWIKSVIASKLRVDPGKIFFVPHHLSHAAASFYPSPFDRAAVLTLDGVGEWTTGTMGVAKDTKITLRGELRFPHSVALLYSTFTAYLGFEVNDGEYKVMGMAGYGKPKYLNRVKKLFKLRHDGSIELDLDYFSFHTSGRRMYSQKFIKEFGEYPQLRQSEKFDIAASLQRAVEEIILTMAEILSKETGETNLVYGGGVALNSVVNALIREKTPFKNVFIFPAAGDDGGAVGAALYLYHHVLGYQKRYPLKSVFLGKSWSREEIGEFLKRKNIRFKNYHDYNLYNFVVDQLVKGKVIGWFEGKAEFGLRALGHRSILADPQNPKMKDIVNAKIKFREEFRPFAPVVLAEQAKKYFPAADPHMSPFMLATLCSSGQAKRHGCPCA